MIVLNKDIYLSEILEKDLPIIIDWKNDTGLANLIMAEPQSLTNEEISLWLNKNINDKNQVILGIYNHFNNELIGLVRLMFIDFNSGVSELAIYIGSQKNRGKGYGKQALDELINLAFHKMQLRKLFLRVRSDNKPAIDLYLKSGFYQEGCLKKHFKSENGIIDVLIYSIFNSNKV